MGRQRTEYSTGNWKKQGMIVDPDQLALLNSMAAMEGIPSYQLLKEILAEGLERRAERFQDRMRERLEKSAGVG